jgi:hypothetical protein
MEMEWEVVALSWIIKAGGGKALAGVGLILYRDRTMSTVDGSRSGCVCPSMCRVRKAHISRNGLRRSAVVSAASSLRSFVENRDGAEQISITLNSFSHNPRNIFLEMNYYTGSIRKMPNTHFFLKGIKYFFEDCQLARSRTKVY